MRDDDLRHWDSPRIRENHDMTQWDRDEEERAEKWVGAGVLVLVFFGIWKLIDLAVAAIRSIT